jgi:hypothetical protein
MTNTISLPVSFFTGGKATFTVDNGQGEHYTFKIRQPKRQDERFTGTVPHFVSLLTGPDNTSSYTYLGVMCPTTGSVRLTKKSKYTSDTKPVKVVSWAMKHVYGDRQLPEGYQIRHEGKCGCCGRALTHPESLSRGIGPECWEKMGGM